MNSKFKEKDMGVYELLVEVNSVGYSTVDESLSSDADKKGMLIKLSDRSRYDGFHEKWFLIPEAHEKEMLDIAIAAISNEKRLCIGVEGEHLTAPGPYKEFKNQPFPEIKSMFLSAS